MSRGILIKFVVVLVVAVLVYSVFWFFKMGQVEKQINKFVSENSAYISAGEISVSGFPLSQKVSIKDLKFSIPTALLGDRQVVVKHLQAEAGIFSSDFAVTLVEPVTVQDLDGNVANVEFSKDPEIMISLSEGRIAKFNYQGFGYRILDMEKNVIYAASSSTISLNSTVDDSDKITTNIVTSIKDIEGYGVIDAYKNSLEKKIIDGLKTGEIVIGNSNPALVATQNTVQVANIPASAVVAAQAQMSQSAPVVQNQQPSASQVSTQATQAQVPANANVAQGATPNAVAQNAAPASSVAQNNQQPVATNSAPVASSAPQEIPATIADNSIVKSNFSLNFEYVLTPNHNEQQPQIPLDPTQIQEAPLQYSKSIRIVSLEFVNPLYKISINGEMNVLADDSLPSGGISVRVENLDNLINQLSSGFVQMAEKVKPAVAADAPVQSSELASVGTPIEDSYQIFLQRMSQGLSPISKELADKNAVSKEGTAQFDVRREKNLDFLINETTLREILGKF